MLLIMLRLRIYIENTTDIMFPTAVTINCQSLGLGMLRRFFAEPKKMERNRKGGTLNLGTRCWVAKFYWLYIELYV